MSISHSYLSIFNRVSSMSGKAIFSHLIMVAVGITDTVMMGWISKEALAAGGLVNSILVLFFVSSIGIIMGGIPLIGSCFGSNNVKLVGSIARHNFLAAIILASIAALLLVAMPLCLSYFKQSALVVANAKDYAWIIWPALYFQLLVFAQKSFLMSIEKVRWFNIIGLLIFMINIAGNYIFMYGLLGMPEMGISGIALSSVLVHAAGFICFSMIILSKPIRKFNAFGLPHKINRKILNDIFNIGWPISVILFLEYTLLSASFVLMGVIDAERLAAHTIAMQWVNILIAIPIGISQTSTSLISISVGQSSLIAARRITHTAILLSVFLIALMATILQLNLEAAVKLFFNGSGTSHQVVFKSTLEFMQIVPLMVLFNGLVVVIAGILRGYRDSRSSLLIVAIGYWVFGVGIAILLSMFLSWGGIGIWFGLTSGFFYSLIAISIKFLYASQNLKSTIQRNNESNKKYA